MKRTDSSSFPSRESSAYTGSSSASHTVHTTFSPSASVVSSASRRQGLRRRMQAKLWQALYFKFDYEKEYLPQLEENLVWLGAELQKLTDYQQRRNTYRKK